MAISRCLVSSRALQPMSGVVAMTSAWLEVSLRCERLSIGGQAGMLDEMRVPEGGLHKPQQSIFRRFGKKTRENRGQVLLFTINSRC